MLIAETDKSTEIKIPVTEKFYIFKNETLSLVTKKNIYRQFSNSKAKIKRFLSKNKISLRNHHDIRKLFTYCDNLQPQKISILSLTILTFLNLFYFFIENSKYKA